MDRKDAYLKSQLGNSEGADRPNKKHLDRRAWLSLAEKGMTDRLVQACGDLGSLGKFSYFQYRNNKYDIEFVKPAQG